MANLILAATGDWGTAATWGVADTTMAKTDGTTSTAVTTGNLDSGAFTPGAITVDGILLNHALRNASPTGTFTVTLRNSTAGTNVTSVTIDVADLPANQAAAVAPGYWIFYKFSASQLLLAATNYVVRVTSSSSSQINLYSGASNAWNLLLRTTTTAAPGAGDRTFIQAEKTSAGAENALTVTMDNNSSTDYGKIDISDGGTMTYSTAGNTQLRTSGNLDIWPDGVLNIGTVATPVPAGTTAILEFDCSSNVEFGLEIRSGGTFVAQGASKGFSWSYLTANAAASATSLTINDSVGSNWKNTDEIVLASTSRTASETEKKSLTADGSGTTLTIAAITNAHSGTAPNQGEVGNLNRWVKIRTVGASSFYIRANAIATIDMDWVEVLNCGSSTASKRGLDLNTTTGSVNVQYSVFRDCTVSNNSMIYCGTASLDNTTISNNILYNGVNGMNMASGGSFGSAVVIEGNLITNMSTIGFLFGDIRVAFNDNHICGNAAASYCVLLSNVNTTNAPGTMSDNVLRSNGVGLTVNDFSGTLDGWYIGRHAGSNGIGFEGANQANSTYPLIFQDCNIYANTGANVRLNGSTQNNTVEFNGCNLGADASFATTNGISIATGGALTTFNFISCTLGAGTTHTSDVAFSASGQRAVNLYFSNTTFNSATEVSTQTTLGSNNSIRSSRHNGTASNYKAWFRYGTIVRDTVTFNTASPSEQLTPNNASFKLKSALKYVSLNNGQTATVTVYVRKTVAGNQPRLVVVANPSAGITSDTVLDTMTAGTATWEQLSGTTAAVTEDCVLAFYVDCDSSAGVINLDDWDASAS